MTPPGAGRGTAEWLRWPQALLLADPEVFFEDVEVFFDVLFLLPEPPDEPEPLLLLEPDFFAEEVDFSPEPEPEPEQLALSL